MSHDLDTRTFAVGGIPISVVTMTGLVSVLLRRFQEGGTPGAFVVFRDAHGVVRAQDDARLRAAHEAALLVCPDGRPMYWLGRVRGFSDIGQVPGIEAVEAVCRAGIPQGWRHYFYGGGPGVADRLAASMSARVPGLQVAGTETPPYRALTPGEIADMHRRIGASNAQIVWVGLSTPKQELWMAEHAPHWPGVVAMGVGAAFDVNIGSIPRAPRWLQVSGLEWLYRLVREPKRLFRRYIEVIPRFALLALADVRGRKTSPKGSNDASG